MRAETTHKIDSRFYKRGFGAKTSCFENNKKDSWSSLSGVWQLCGMLCIFSLFCLIM